jgi:hypothetical protein
MIDEISCVGLAQQIDALCDEAGASSTARMCACGAVIASELIGIPPSERRPYIVAHIAALASQVPELQAMITTGGLQ